MAKSQNSQFTVAAASVRLAGLLTQTSAEFSRCKTRIWKMVRQRRRSIGRAQARFCDVKSVRAAMRSFVWAAPAMPNQRATSLPPFKDNYAGSDGFWYGEWFSNMRFDVDGKEGRDQKGDVFFGSVNTNAGTPDDGPRNSFKIEVGPIALHLLTVFSPASGARGAMPEHHLNVRRWKYSNGAVRRHARRRDCAIPVRRQRHSVVAAKHSGGMGAPRPGASAAALFFD